MALTLFTSPRPLRRAGATGVTCLALAGLGAGSAVAASTPVVPLTPSALALALLPIESLPDDAGALQDMTGVDALDPTQFVAVGSAYGGTLTVHLPAPLDGAHLVATLDVPATGAGPDPAHDAIASSSGADPKIRVTPAGTDTYTITLPSSADLGTTHGDDGYLELSGITTPLGGAAAFVVLPYRLGLGAGDASTELDPVLFAAGQVPGTSVAAGASLQVTLPRGSDLQDLGVDTLAPGAFVLQDVGPDGQPTDAPPVPLEATVSPDGSTATLAVPAGTPVGTYVLAVVLPDGSETTITITVAQLSITAAQAVPAVAPLPAAPVKAAPVPAQAPAPVAAAPAVHRGLRSNTDWADHTGAPATAPAVAQPTSGTRSGLATGGAAALLVAALCGVAGGAVRAGRRRTLRG